MLYREYTIIHGPKPSLVDWFRSQIWKLYTEGDPRVTTELLSLSRGPSKSVKSYQGYYVNGYRFHTKKRQRRRKTQNSGVIVKGDAESGEKDFFGVLKEVIELEYDAPNSGDTKPIVVLFRCVWFDVYRRGIKRDKFGGVSLNFKKFLGTNEPFAMASQVGQVYYVRAHNEPDWRIVIKTVPRNFYNFPIVEVDGSDDDHDDVGLDFEVPNSVEGDGDDGDDDDDDDVLLPRNDVPPELVNASDFELENEVVNEEEEEDSEQDEQRELDDEEEEEEEEEIPGGLYDLDSE
ncbi:rRNA-processing protein EFG1-like [Spinacia oleracea]|uniref:rRNA-processing protein EFG1-like n=1 Tax=Spinacia oleracea TaxID=3562 RepID=A0ABM3RPD4_SPIOL|nr:rRNA-processing protein EFG1-like [Spinacia oleracea]